MKRLKSVLGIVILFALIMGLMTACGSSKKEETSENEKSKTLIKLQKQGYITVAIDGTVPFAYKDKDSGELTGVDGDITVAICKKLGIKKIRIDTTSFDSAIQEVKNGNADVFSNAMYITKERKKLQTLVIFIIQREKESLLTLVRILKVLQI
ncbi:MAG: transporter substrate-binding domain-containing protein [Anaerostipes sp.]|nr:transporter substrate-binding domain-containing protein [Anaerostipes sp.]